MKGKMKVRPATVGDLRAIMEVEKATFGQIGSGASATKSVMKKRISLCNKGLYNWFLVAESDDGVVGYMILQPTSLTSNKCTSWHHATDNGELQKTFDENGENIYVVSFAVKEDAPQWVGTFLAHASITEWLRSGKKCFMFCSRMPGFTEMRRKKKITPERYWRLTRRDGSPYDPMLNYYWSMLGGVHPRRLLKNGFPPDKESDGYGVLFVAQDPLKSLRAIIRHIYSAGFGDGRSVQKGGDSE